MIELKQLLASLVALVLALQGYMANPPPARFSPKPIPNELILGTATGSGSFPTSTLNNFQDGDVINSGDWNALERKIGIDNSTDTTSLDYKLRNVSSSDPGHKHTTSSIPESGNGNVTATGTVNYFPYYTATTTLSATSPLSFQNANNLNIFSSNINASSTAFNFDGVLGDKTIRIIGSPAGSQSSLSILSGDAITEGNNVFGGDLFLKSGVSTGNAGSNIRLYTSTPGTSGTSTNSVEEKVRIMGNGYIGIGTTQPSTTVDIIGNVRVSSGIQANYIQVANIYDYAGLVSTISHPTGRVDIGNNSPLHIFDTNNWVSIGTLNPSSTFHVIGDSTISGTSTVRGRMGVGTTQPSSTFHVIGNFQLVGSSSVVTPSLGGGSLAAGACATVTSSIDSSVTSSTAAFITTPQNYPGAGFWWDSYLSSSSVVTTRVCAVVIGTPTATPYVVKIIK